MAFTTGFANDVFISYAHIDNTQRWVTDFHKLLQDRLDQIAPGAGITIWRDLKLNELDVFSQEIFDQLKASAVLLSIVTPGSIRSGWCEAERQKFEVFAAATGGFRLGNTLRAVSVVKTPLDDDAHRKLFPVLGFEFYERDRGSKIFKEFQPSGDPFGAKLNELAQRVRALLVEMNGRPPRKPRSAVYVALSAELDERRRRIVEELSAWKIPVLPEAPIPIDTPGFRAAVDSALEQCQLSVHFAGAHRGPIPDEEEKPVALLQYELARDHRLPRVVWIEPGAPAHESLSTLASGGEEGTEVLNKPNQNIEDLKQLVNAKLRRLRSEPIGGPGTEERRTVYLLCDVKDHPSLSGTPGNDRARQLKSYLDERGYRVWLPPVGIDEEKLREEDHKSTLDISDGVLLFWGAAEEFWFRKRLRELTTIQIDRSHRPFLARALYLTVPPVGKDQYRKHLDLVIEQFEQFRPEELAPFDDALNPLR